MQTYSLNSLAEQFEIDRSTMVKALRNVPPDLENTKGRPQWKISTAARALENHRRNTGRDDSRCPARGGAVDVDGQDPLLSRIYAEIDDAEAAMRKLPSVTARRKAALAMAPMIARMDQAIRERGEATGQDPDLVGLRADKLFMLALRGFETPCQWTMSETWAAVNDGTD
jgi:hypothetical protein